MVPSYESLLAAVHRRLKCGGEVHREDTGKERGWWHGRAGDGEVADWMREGEGEREDPAVLPRLRALH